MPRYLTLSKPKTRFRMRNTCSYVVFGLEAALFFGGDEGLLEGFEGAIGLAAEGGFVKRNFCGYPPGAAPILLRAHYTNT
jgi:hypothetical protein